MELKREIFTSIRAARPEANVTVAASSVTREDGVAFALVEIEAVEKLCVSGAEGAARGFEAAEEIRASGAVIRLCPLTHENAVELRKRLPFTAPSILGKKEITIGVGDRLGMAGRGHIRAIRGYRASPVLSQQSVRELTLTSRSFTEVLDSSTWAVFAEGFRSPWGADGDHLKAEDKVKEALTNGFTMITADVSDHLHTPFLSAGDADAGAAYASLDPGYRKDVEARYLSRPFGLASGGSVSFTPLELKKTVLAYRDALEHAAALYRAGTSVKRSGGFDFELSIDETDSPTSPQAHVFMAVEARRIGIPVTSMAPRFVGEFQKGIDYIGSVKDFESGFALHADIAEAFGHRISVHSGSDKFSVFPAVGRLSRGKFHLKTAGTSWLEALRVIASSDLPLFRDLYSRALERYPAARALYHVTPDLSRLPAVETLDERSAPALLGDIDARRVLHITYGEMLSVPELKQRLFGVLTANAETYRAGLQSHIGRHLETLGVPKDR
jgi:hypothetical protein